MKEKCDVNKEKYDIMQRDLQSQVIAASIQSSKVRKVFVQGNNKCLGIDCLPQINYTTSCPAMFMIKFPLLFLCFHKQGTVLLTQLFIHVYELVSELKLFIRFQFFGS